MYLYHINVLLYFIYYINKQLLANNPDVIAYPAIIAK